MAALRIHCYLGYGHTDAPKVVSQKQGFYGETLRSTLGKHHWERLCQGLWFVPGRVRHFCCSCEIIVFQCFNRSNPWYFKLNVWNIVISQLWRMGLQAIAGGEAEEALTVLTGWPCQTILFDQEAWRHGFDPCRACSCLECFIKNGFRGMWEFVKLGECLRLSAKLSNLSNMIWCSCRPCHVLRFFG